MTTFVINGRGWGHGVGMPQWGAYGYAQHGVTYDKILAHYYPGTTLAAGAGREDQGAAASIRRGTIVVSSPDPFYVDRRRRRPARSRRRQLPADSALKVKLDPDAAAAGAARAAPLRRRAEPRSGSAHP